MNMELNIIVIDPKSSSHQRGHLIPFFFFFSLSLSLSLSILLRLKLSCIFGGGGETWVLAFYCALLVTFSSRHLLLRPPKEKEN